MQTVDLSKAPLRSPKAGGAPLFPRKLQKITFVQYLDGTEESDEPNLIPADELPKESPEQPKDPAEGVVEDGKINNPEPKEPIRPVPNPEDENWGIEQMDLF